MALRAPQRSMLPFERERALAVRLEVKEGGLEARHVVTGRAVRSGRARGDLAFVRFFMARLAALVRDGALELRALVAFGTR